MKRLMTVVLMVVVVGNLVKATAAPAADGYDPLAVAEAALPAPLELVVHDTDQVRDIPVRIYLPAATTAAPIVLFSHGLGGTRAGSAYLGQHWAARGYVAVFVQHAGSDDSVWRDLPLGERLEALRQAANLESFLHRVKDIPAVLNQLKAWDAEDDHPLHGRLDSAHVGMSGHSYGAMTTQAVSGQAYAGDQEGFTDARIKAAIAFSPSSPRRGTPAEAFGAVKIPWLLMTGTNDTAPISEQTVETRRAVFAALPPGGKYELVLDGAEHSAFTDRALPGDQLPRNPNHHRAILAISTAFWDAYLRDDAAAKAWLDGDGPRGVLEAKDEWQKK